MSGPPAPATVPSNHSALIKEVEQATGVPVSACFQCRKCTNGCPMDPEMGIHPSSLIRLLQLGQVDRVMSSGAFWMCVSCETCFARCPNDIDLPRVMDYLRQRAMATEPASGGLPITFHRSFVRSLRRNGRVYEVGMLAGYKLRSGQFFQDVGLGWKMFTRGKLRLLPRRIKGRKALKALFRPKS